MDNSFASTLTLDTSAALAAQTVSDFQRDGVVHLPGVFSDWLDTLEQGAEFNIAHPGARALTHKADSHQGMFLEDFCNWQRIPEYEDFIRHSPLAAIAAQLMQSRSVQFFHDHFLYKEASSGVPTPWHQDIPYYCVSGLQTVSFWIPLEARAQQVSLRCAAGSHLLDKEIRPTSWSTNESFYADDSQFMDIPDIDNSDFVIREWAMQPGDAVAFDFRTIHGAHANTTENRSRTLSFRVVGDDARYRQRAGRTSPDFPDINQQTGERLRSDWFPVIYNHEQPR